MDTGYVTNNDSTGPTVPLSNVCNGAIVLYVKAGDNTEEELFPNVVFTYPWEVASPVIRQFKPLKLPPWRPRQQRARDGI